MNIRITELTDSRDSVNKWMERYGVRFGVYKNGVFNEQLFPFDPVPRVISNDDWSYLEQGLKQRVQALNKFLWDVYHEKKIIKDGIVPEEFVYSSKGYMPECEQINPTGGVYAHIAGIDLVEGKNGQWYVLEDNKVYYSGIYKERTRVGCIYRRVSDEYMDPLVFEASSLLGIPNVMQAYKAGNVALVNAIGNGVADDKGIYYFVPKMVEYYLDEKPILQNAPTYLPYFKEDYDYVLSNIQRLVIKDVSEAGGYGVVFGKDLSEEKLEELKTLIISQPRRWIAQEVIDFKDLKVLDDTDSSSSVDGTAGVCQSVSEGMKRYLYNYQTIVTFSEPVSAHAVMLRCQPAANAFQTIEQEHIIVSPDYWMNAGTDAFGNRILFGGASEPHTVFAYVSTGIVATETYFQKQRGENMFLYSQPSQLTQLSVTLQEL